MRDVPRALRLLQMSLIVAAHDFHSLPIKEVRRETPEAISISLEVPETLRAQFVWKPGQHVTLRTTLGGEEQRRTYSICSTPHDNGLQIAIKRVAGGNFSTWADDTLTAGQHLEVMPPTGRFILPASDGQPRHILAIAAGAGITPIIAMVQHALVLEPETTVTLIYGNRTSQSTMFRERLEDLKDRHVGRFTLLNVLSRNTESDAPLLEGRIDGDKVRAMAGALLRLDTIDHIFLCGPGTMIKEARNVFLELGIPRDRIHHEFFAAGGGAYRQAPAPPIVSDDRTAGLGTGTEVMATIDGIRHIFNVPLGTHVVDAALAAGVRVPYSCKGGMCCTCRARVIEGAAQMTTNYSLEPWEIARGFILTCQAIPEPGRLVLDYDQM
jgi:ring-1,2-phenylacetyl-CoA epoxidase subunit PaaE